MLKVSSSTKLKSVLVALILVVGALALVSACDNDDDHRDNHHHTTVVVVPNQTTKPSSKTFTIKPTVTKTPKPKASKK